MSQPLIAARKAPVRSHSARPETAAQRPELQVVAPPAVRRARLPLPVLCVVLLTLGLFGLLMTNISIAGDAYEITDLRVEQQRLADRQQASDEALAAASSPEQLAARAAELGMVPAPAPVHLSSSGSVGEPVPAPTPTTEESSPAADEPTGAAAGPATD